MISSLVAGLVLGVGQDVAKDYRLPVMSVEAFGKWYHEQTGEFVVVRPEVGGRDVYINVRKRIPQEVLEFVLQAVDLKLIRENGALTFSEGPGIGDDVVFRDWAKQIASIAPGTIDKLQLESASRAYLDVQQGSSEKYSSVRSQAEIEFEKNEPGNVVMRQFMEGLGVERLRHIMPGERAIFSTRPTSLQLKWPVAGDTQIKWLNEICSVKNDLVTSLNDRGFRVWSRYSMTNISCVYGGMNEPVVAMRAEVKRDPENFVVQLGFYRSDGVQIAQFWKLFSIGKGWPLGEGSEVKLRDDLKGVLKFSDSDIREMVRLRRLLGWSDRRSSLDRSDLEFFAGIDRRNPFSGTITKMLDFACQESGNELVMEVVGSPNGILERDSFEAKYMSWKFADVRNGLVVIKPDWESVMERRKNLPKSAIAWLARKGLSQGTVLLEDVANVIRSGMNRDEVAALLTAVDGMTNPVAGDDDYEPDSWEVFLIMAYAQLDSRGRAMARGPGGVPFRIDQSVSGISGLFGHQLRLDRLWARFKDPSFGTGDMTRPGIYGRHGEAVEFDHWREEQTEYLADRAMWPGELILKVSSKDVLFSGRGKRMQYDYETPEELGKQLVSSSKRAEELFGVNRVDILDGSVLFGGMETTGDDLRFFTTPVMTDVGLNSLPGPIRDRIRKAQVGGGGK